MHINDFKSIVTTFVDPGTDYLFEKNRLLISVNGNLLTVDISTQNGDVYVDAGAGDFVPASFWILRSLAKLDLLASRLKDCVSETSMFVAPPAILLPSLTGRPEGIDVPTNNALITLQDTLDAKSPLETRVLYITSDAGEGKTFLINRLAKDQAQRFIEKKSDWLLVPIPLGGKHFLRFDDITVGALQNRYRFPFLYYDSFLALVKMGVIIPAFDGFEEMFVENSSGEALSAMGTLVNLLDSRGTLVIAARKAYFEFENLKSQEKLFDTISSYSVGFEKLELQRWGFTQFITYCNNRTVKEPQEIYETVSERLGSNHSLLTRPVLVRRLVDIATESPSLDSLLEKIEASGADFFSVFVRGIIEREANEKWIDRSGEGLMGAPLLSVDEHCELLSSIALATWEAKVDFLKRDYLEFVADLFCEAKKKNPHQAQQIRDRVRGHALLISSPNASNAIEFDHEEFRLFFLGEGIVNQIKQLDEKSKSEVFTILRKGILPKQSQDAIVHYLNRSTNIDNIKVANLLLEISTLDGQASYTQENCSSLIIRILSNRDALGLTVNGLIFAPDALRDGKLTGINFTNCFFNPSSIQCSTFYNCIFTRCHFAQIRIYDSSNFNNVVFDNCIVDAIQLKDKEIEFWDPNLIRTELEKLTISFSNDTAIPVSNFNIERADQQIREIEKLIRYFMRSTHIGESVLQMKLGVDAQSFLDNTLPQLIKRGIIVEIDNRGGNNQRRFKFGMTLESINRSLSSAQGSFQAFMDNLTNHPPTN